MASVLGLLGDFVSRHWQRVHEANATYQKNAEYDRDKSADEIAQTCGDLTALQFRECVRNNLEAHYNDQATNEDLQAQQDMAFWAMLLLFVSIFGVITSTFGVVLLISTIRQGKLGLDRAAIAVNVAREANKIMQQEQRPWVTLERELYCDFLENGHGCQIIWNRNFTNKGKSPAHNVRHNWKVLRCHRSANAAYLVKEFVEKTKSNPPFFHTPLIFPGETTDFPRNQSSGSFRYEDAKISAEDEEFILITCITYGSSVLGEDVFVEARAFKIVHKRGFGPFSTKMLEYDWTRYIQ